MIGGTDIVSRDSFSESLKTALGGGGGTAIRVAQPLRRERRR